MNTKEKIYKFIKEHEEVRPVDLFYNFSISRGMIHRHLNTLVQEGRIEKFGKSPYVTYSVKEQDKNIKVDFNKETKEFLDKHFYFVSPSGKEYLGSTGFIIWCKKRNFNMKKKAKEYMRIIKKYQRLKKDGLFDATSKFRKTFNDRVCVDKAFYFDFYSIEIFGKTKIGQQLLLAKQTQNKNKMIEIIETIKPVVESLIKREKIDSVVFVPPTVPRDIQFMKMLERRLDLNLPKVNVRKRTRDILVPQKTLKKLEDRIENAQTSFYIKDKGKFKNILIIDDAVGSGASINEISCKLKNLKNANIRTVGFAIVGSLNDFEVISEV